MPKYNNIDKVRIASINSWDVPYKSFCDLYSAEDATNLEALPFKHHTSKETLKLLTWWLKFRGINI